MFFINKLFISYGLYNINNSLNYYQKLKSNSRGYLLNRFMDNFFNFFYYRTRSYLNDICPFFALFCIHQREFSAISLENYPLGVDDQWNKTRINSFSFLSVWGLSRMFSLSSLIRLLKSIWPHCFFVILNKRTTRPSQIVG